MQGMPSISLRRIRLLVILLVSVGFGLGLLRNNFRADGEILPIASRSAGEFVSSIGVTTHLNQQDHIQNNYFSDVFTQVIKPKLHALGVRHIRQYTHDVSSEFPGLVSKYNQISNDGPVGVSFNFETEIENSGSSSPRHECFLPKLKYLMFGTASNCGGLSTQTSPSQIKTKSVENPNEPDHCASYICGQSNSSNWFQNSLSRNPDWPDDILLTSQALHTKLRSDPATQGLEILAPSYVWLSYHKNETYGGKSLEEYLESVKSYVTHGNVHPYCHLLSVAECFANQVQPVVSYYSPKPVIVTETGHSTANYSERQQAKYLLRILFDFFGRGIQRTYIYELLDEPSAATPTERNHGLIKADGTEKLAYQWLKNVLNLLKDNESFTPESLPIRISGPSSLRSVLLQKSDGSHWLALQNDRSQTADTDQTVNASLEFADLKSLSVFNPQSTDPTLVKDAAKTLSLDVPDSIILVKIANYSSPNSSSSGTTGQSAGQATSGNRNNRKAVDKNDDAESGNIVQQTEGEDQLLTPAAVINELLSWPGELIAAVIVCLVGAFAAAWVIIRKRKHRNK